MTICKHFILTVPWVFCLSLAAQPSAPANQPPPSENALPPQNALQPEDASYVLGPNDQIKIWALGLEELSDKPVRLDPSGNIDLPGVGQVHAAGLTVEQLKVALVARFSTQILHPQVAVQIVDYGSQPVSIIGAVNHPGVHQLEGRKTLVEVLSLADGLREDAGFQVTISREIRYGPIPLLNDKPDATGQFSVAEVEVKELLAGSRPAENILIMPHDVITVPIAGVVFVIGEVRKPGEVALKNRGSISVLQALSSAEGFGPTPAPQNSKIVRMVPGSQERIDIPVDLAKIVAGKGEDIELRPNDILVVPISGPKKMAARIAEAAIQAATGMVIFGRP